MSIRTKAPLLSGLLILTILACSVNDINISAQPNYELTITAQALAIQLTGQAPAQPGPQGGGEPGADFRLVAIVTRAVEVPVTCADRLGDDLRRDRLR